MAFGRCVSLTLAPKRALTYTFLAKIKEYVSGEVRIKNLETGFLKAFCYVYEYIYTEFEMLNRLPYICKCTLYLCMQMLTSYHIEMVYLSTR